MDLLHLAWDSYRLLAPLLSWAPEAMPSPQLDRWLRDRVCPVVDQLRANRAFQRLARWSPDHLAPGAETAERRLVETVDRELVNCARRTADVAAKLGKSSARSAPAPARRAVKDLMSGSDWPTDELSAPSADAPVAAWIAQRPWVDLVCPAEYFYLYRGLHLRESHAEHTAEFWRRCALPSPLGDHVLRAMFARIEYLTGALQPEWQRWFVAAAPQGQSGYELADRLFSAKVRLEKALEELRAECLAPELARRRQAYATLVQVYAAYHPSPELGWLGCPPGTVKVSGPILRRLIGFPVAVISEDKVAQRGLSLGSAAAIQGIAAALTDVENIYRRPLESEDLIAWAREAKRLVMVDRRPRTLFWQGQEVSGTWDRWPTRWDLLWKLAQRALRHQPVDREELTNAGSDTRAVVNRRHHLGKCLPRELDCLIEDARPRGYRLKLEPEEILLLQLDSDEQFLEVGPTKPNPVFSAGPRG